MNPGRAAVNHPQAAIDELCVPHAFSFGHVRQLEAVVGKALERAWALGAGPGDARLVLGVDSTICEVYDKAKAGAAFGYTKVLGYHPIVATRADTGEIIHARMRKGSANTQRGTKRFVEELVARARRAGATGQIVARFDFGLLVERDDRNPQPARRALHDGSASQQQGPGQGCCSCSPVSRRGGRWGRSR